MAIYRRQRQHRRLLLCGTCGSGVWYRARPYHDAYAIPLGNFAPGHGFIPDYSVYEERKEPWVSITGEAIEHYD